MKIINFFCLISFCLFRCIFKIEQIYILNENNLQKNNFSIIYNIQQFFEKCLNINKVFEITLESENSEESNKKIVFKCHLFYGLTYKDNSYLKWTLKERNVLNVKVRFYFRNKHINKYYMIENKKETLNISFEILEEIFYIGMIQILSNSRDIFGFECNFRFSILLFQYQCLLMIISFIQQLFQFHL